MAITENDLTISNKSYTNKDFEAVYDELLTLAKKISYKYDPTNSNESDPFIVLLKLLSFATDKINYNIDKNILERFMPSATQESSMQDLTQRMGYNMHYYTSATTDVYFKYNYPQDYSGDNIKIPQFSIIKNDASDVQYVTLREVEISKTTGVSTVTPVIQGSLNQFTALENTTITLDNLDENNRLYFSEQMIAQNGVYILGGNYPEKLQPAASEFWDLVDNLNSQIYEYPCYVFRYDSLKKLPYIEFPEWITKIIGDGLNIKYLSTAGSNGNVKAWALTTVDASLDEDVVSAIQELDSEFSASSIQVKNPSAAENGQDIETINEAYNGFKKTIGTFDTLVTCRDYANYIYNYLDEVYSKNIVSNVQVADRRTDINYGCSVVQYGDFGVQIKSMPEYSGSTESISAFDLCIYPLNPVYNVSSNNTTNAYYPNYGKTFKPLYDHTEIENAIEESKCLSHNYKELKTTDIAAIKNYYSIDAIVTTNQKVNDAEELSIVTNIKNALAENFNSREVDYGYEIPYETLLDVIEAADSRIRSVNLKEPDQKTVALLYGSSGTGSEEIPIYNSTTGLSNDWYKKVVSKNVFAGRIPLFNYNTDFEYTYDQNSENSSSTHPSNLGVFEDVTKFDSSCNISSISSGNEYELLSNEAIQLIAPNYITDVTYPYGINYYLKLHNDTSQTVQATEYYQWEHSTRTTTYDISVIFNDGSSITREQVYSFTVSGTTYLLPLGTTEINEFKTKINKVFCFTITYSQTTGNDPELVYFNQAATGISIPKNTYYTLVEGDSLIFNYTNNSDQEIFIEYTEGDIVKPNLDLYTSKYRQTKRYGYTSGETPTKTVENKAYYTLSTNDQVEHVNLNQETLTSEKKCYWYVNDTNNQLNWTPIYDSSSQLLYYEYLLEENEYFFYSDINMTALYEYGSGTKLKLGKDIYGQASDWIVERVADLSTVIEEGLSALKDLFKYVKFKTSGTTTDSALVITEQQIITLTTNDILKVKYAESESPLVIYDNKFTEIPSTTTIQYKIEGTETYIDLPTIASSEIKWNIRSILDINVGPDLEQTLEGNQHIKLYYGSSSAYADLYEPATFKFNVLKQISGGVGVDLTYKDALNQIQYPTCYSYIIDSNVANKLTAQSDNTYKFNYDSNGQSIVIDLPILSNTEIYFMLNSVGTTNNITITYSSTKSDVLTDYTYNQSFASGSTVASEMRIIQVPANTDIKTLTFTITNKDASTLIISAPKLVYYGTSGSDRLNPLLGLQSGDNIESYMRTNYENQFHKFYAIADIDDTKAIEVSATYDLSNSLTFYDYNNIANEWVLPELDFTTITNSREDDFGMNIRVARSSKK